MIYKKTLVRLRGRLNAALRVFGLQRYVKQPNWKRYDVEIIVDVGVAWGTDFLINNYPNAQFFLIEPNPMYHQIIKDRIMKNYNCVLITAGAGAKEQKLKLALNGLESTFFYGKNNDAKKHIVDVMPLDLILDQKNYFDINKDSLLKIDTEGFEMSVLKGSEKVLRHGHLKAIIIEIVFTDKKDQRSNISDIFAFLYSFDFVFDQIVKFRLRPTGISYIDMAFVRTVSPEP